MGTIMENAAADIVALGTEAGGCDCTYFPQGGAGVACRAIVSFRAVEDAGQGRGTIGIPTQKRLIGTVIVQRIQGGILKADRLQAGDYFTVPGHKAGRPDQATVKVAVGKLPRLIQNSHWTGELTL